MSSLIFLWRKTMKNRIVQMKRKPGLIVMYLIFIALMVFSFANMKFSDFEMDANSDISVLKLIFMLYCMLFAATGIQTGLSTGGSFFTMPDVNLIFVSPLEPKKVLVYGILNQTVKSLLASFFIILIGPTLGRLWGINLGGLLILFISYVLALVIFQLLSVVLYIYSNSRPKAKKVVIICAVAFVIPTLVYFIYSLIVGGGNALSQTMNSGIIYTMPLVGWISQFAFSAMLGDFTAAAISLSLIIASVALIIFLMFKGRSDYYEDVIVAAETFWQRQQAAKDGSLQGMEAKAHKAGKIKEGTEIRGLGAKVFFSKHMLENRRKSRLVVFDASSVMYIVMGVVMAVIASDGGLMVPLLMLMTLRVMLVGVGLGLKELFMHYIFMIPASSISKLIWSNLEICVKGLAENAITLIIAGIIIKAAWLDVVFAIIVSTVFVFFLVAVNLLSMRLLSNNISQGILLGIYMIFVVIVMAPGVIGAVVCGIYLPAFGLWLPLLILTLWELIMALVFFAASRGVLDSCDMETTNKQLK